MQVRDGGSYFGKLEGVFSVVEKTDCKYRRTSGTTISGSPSRLVKYVCMFPLSIQGEIIASEANEGKI